MAAIQVHAAVLQCTIELRASERAGPTGMQEGASGGGGPGREVMAMAVCGNLVTTRPRRGAARIMLASRWRDHRRFLPPAEEVKDNGQHWN